MVTRKKYRKRTAGQTTKKDIERKETKDRWKSYSKKKIEERLEIIKELKEKGIKITDELQREIIKLQYPRIKLDNKEYVGYRDIHTSRRFKPIKEKKLSEFMSKLIGDVKKVSGKKKASAGTQM